MDFIVVVGASQGGVNALRELIGALPRAFPAPIVVVLHVGRAQSALPSLLNDVGGPTASHSVDGEELRPGHVHVAPPDRHLMVRDGKLMLTRGPRENWARPAIDPLFRSAAEVFGKGAIGVVLTGLLNDGTAGLFEIKRRGGVAIVQDPAEAQAPSMPRSALENVAVDYALPVADIAAELVRLVEVKPKREARTQSKGVARAQEHGANAMEKDQTNIQTPTAQTCPECGGAMREETQGSFKTYRCHIGHRLTAEILAQAQLFSIDVHLDSIVRLLNEHTAVCREIADRHQAQSQLDDRDLWLAAAKQSLEREAVVRKMTEEAWINPENAPATSEDEETAESWRSSARSR